MKIRNEFLPVSRPSLQGDELERVAEVIRSGWWTTGPACALFEESFSAYLGEELHCVGLNSCTAALHVALLALGIGEGDEVIVPTWTFASTAHVVEWVGAKPVLCDIEGDSLNIDVRKAEALCTEKTKAIMPVHIAGFPCDMDAIAALAAKKNLAVIEDAAHAIGTAYKGKKIGNFSHVTCFSFYATKNLAMGEGGAAVARDKELADRMRVLGYLGINKDGYKRYEKSGTWRYDVAALGYKYNLDSMHAAMGLEQLKHLDSMNVMRRSLAARYRENLHSSITPSRDSNEHYHCYHLFPVFLPKGIDRDDFIAHLKEYNIGTSVHFIPLHLHSYYEKYAKPGTLPVAESYFTRVVSLPMHCAMTCADVDYVVEVANNFIKQQK